MWLFEPDRYFFSITNDRTTPASEIVFLANDRCDQEHLIAQLKGGVKALAMPVGDLESKEGRPPARYRSTRPFSVGPPPNRTCGFDRIRLSRDPCPGSVPSRVSAMDSRVALVADDKGLATA